MSDKYTEAARKAVFFARFEASQTGGPFIEPEHLLLGIPRQPGHLLVRLLRSDRLESIGEEVRKQLSPRQQVPAKTDLPVSKACRVSHRSRRRGSRPARARSHQPRSHAGGHLPPGALRRRPRRMCCIFGSGSVAQ